METNAQTIIVKINLHGICFKQSMTFALSTKRWWLIKGLRILMHASSQERVPEVHESKLVCRNQTREQITQHQKNQRVTVGRVNTARLLDMCGNHG
jgi:hypothetical protein